MLVFDNGEERGEQSETAKNVSKNAGVSIMSAERGLSAVSAKSASGTFAQKPARIHGIDGGNREDPAKIKSLRYIPSQLICAVEDALTAQDVEIHKQGVEKPRSDPDNWTLIILHDTRGTA